MGKRGMAKRTPAAERARIVAELRASGLGQAAFAALKGIKVGTLQNWLYQRGGGRPVASGAGRFIELTAPLPSMSSGVFLVVRLGAVVLELRELPPPEWVVAVSLAAAAP